LRSAILEIQTKHGKLYPLAETYLKRLEKPENQSGERFDRLQYEALVNHPLVAKHPILFVARPQYISDHHNTETLFQSGEICTGKIYEMTRKGKVVFEL